MVYTPGFCDKHRKEAYRVQKQKVTEDFKERNRFYQRKEWKTLRSMQLQLEPLCRQCRRQGILIQAEIVDHILPITEGGGALDQDNLQSLCKKCHNSKTRKDNARQGGV